jgi:hypothetical protein
MGNTLGSHGAVGRRELAFTRLFPRRVGRFDSEALALLAKGMIGNVGDDASNTPDGEENLAVPAGYTYFGQFIDHDLTFDTTSSFSNPAIDASNLRSPRLDLDCVYGAGPDDQPYLYATETAGGLRKGASLLLGRELQGSNGRRDLLRVGSGDGARAVIGDPRNDENALVCNIQAAFIAFHNAVVNHLSAGSPTLSDRQVLNQARKLVRWTYQRIVTEDYLPRIIEPATHQTFKLRLERHGEGAFQLFSADKRGGIPIEFAGAAYRYGHSMVRTGYKLNGDHLPQKIFTPGLGLDSLMGFGPLPDGHWIEWKRFFPENNAFKAGGERPLKNINTNSARLQWAYRIDTSLVDPLSVLPEAIGNGASLADLNLRRGNLLGLVSGQTVADQLGVPPLAAKYLVMRDSAGGDFGFAPIPEPLRAETPLWFYVLAEAQRELVDAWHAKNAHNATALALDEADLLEGIEDSKHVRTRAPIAQLGPVGGMILLETFYGLLVADSESYLSIAASDDIALSDSWFAHFTASGSRDISMWRLLEFAGQTKS